jgi:putative aldouronate transport system permease protein
MVSRFLHRVRSRSADLVIYLVGIILSLIMLYPFYYMLILSVDPGISRTSVLAVPNGFTLDFYRFIFSMSSVATGYLNSVLYTASYAFLALFLTSCCAYPISKRWLPGRRGIIIFILITMYFSGGLIPLFILVKRLGLYNGIGAVILPGAVATYYVIIMTTFFRALPQELEDAACVDGANEFTILLRVVLPLSKPILATLGLFYAVAQWNSWFGPAIFLNDKLKYPIALVLRNAMSNLNTGTGFDRNEVSQALARTKLDLLTPTRLTDVYSLNYALTIAVVLPILLLYPFLQKYFIKGVMIGSLKG